MTSDKLRDAHTRAGNCFRQVFRAERGENLTRDPAQIDAQQAAGSEPDTRTHSPAAAVTRGLLGKLQIGVVRRLGFSTFESRRYSFRHTGRKSQAFVSAAAAPAALIGNRQCLVIYRTTGEGGFDECLSSRSESLAGVCISNCSVQVTRKRFGRSCRVCALHPDLNYATTNLHPGTGRSQPPKAPMKSDKRMRSFHPLRRFMNSPRSSAAVTLVLSVAALVAAAKPALAHEHDSPAYVERNSPLIERVRQATKRYININTALGENWVQATPCVSGPNDGAMGVHLLLPERLHDAKVVPDEPEMLIYEPLPGGGFRLVGVEYIVPRKRMEQRAPGPSAVS